MEREQKITMDNWDPDGIVDWDKIIKIQKLLVEVDKILADALMAKLRNSLR